MRFILVCLSCGYEREVWSKLRECPRCSSRDIEVLKSRKALEQGIDVPTDARPNLSLRMLILGVIGLIMTFAGMGLIWLAGGLYFIGVILSVIGIICLVVGAIGAWWYD